MTRELKFGTWNIWCDHETLKDRLPLITKELIDVGADIYCLQEVTAESLEYFLKSDLDKLYEFSHGSDFEDIHLNVDNDTVILVKRTSFPKFENICQCEKLIDTDMNRFLYWVDFGDFVTFGSHFESLPKNVEVRQRQAEQVEKVRSEKFKDKPAVFLGDTDFTQLNEGFPEQWNDVWQKLASGSPDTDHEPEKGEVYTYDGKYNNCAERYRSRVDRIYVAGDGITYKDWKFFGTDEKEIKRSDEEKDVPSEDNGLTVNASVPRDHIFPSDHFGVCATITIASGSSKPATSPAPAANKPVSSNGKKCTIL